MVATCKQWQLKYVSGETQKAAGNADCRCMHSSQPGLYVLLCVQADAAPKGRQSSFSLYPDYVGLPAISAVLHRPEAIKAESLLHSGSRSTDSYVVYSKARRQAPEHGRQQNMLIKT